MKTDVVKLKKDFAEFKSFVNKRFDDIDGRLTDHTTFLKSIVEALAVVSKRQTIHEAKIKELSQAL